MMEPVERALKVRAKELRDMGNKYSAKNSIKAALQESIFIRRKEWHVGMIIHPQAPYSNWLLFCISFCFACEQEDSSNETYS